MLKKIKKFKNPKNLFLCILSRFFLFLLNIFYNFDKWHVTGSYYCKPYKKQLVEIINDLKLNSALEIGCGLGCIIKRTKVNQNKFAYDIDSDAIRAAKFLNSNFNKTKTKFYIGSFNEVEQKNIEAIIAVNWMHNFDKRYLFYNLKNLIKKTNCKYFIADGIKKKFKNKYKYCHTVSFWRKFGKIYFKITSVDSVRDFYIIEII